MKIILNDQTGSMTFQQALGELVSGADTLSIAVSYLQVGGWELFSRYARGLNRSKMRLICTDQLGITQPEAVQRAISSGIQIRNFAGSVVYHPKVFLAHDRAERPIRFLLGSANLSSSAFTGSVEAGVLSDESRSLDGLSRWFNELFTRRSEAFTPERLREMELRWRALAAVRTRSRLQVRRAVPVAAPPPPEVDIDTLEDVFATVQLPIGLLNMDYAANNIRNISKVRRVLAEPTRASTKQQSELKLLGFMRARTLTPLGRAAAAARSNETVARLWCQWIQRTPDDALAEINGKLLITKRVFPQFWRLKQQVRDYFLANAQRPSDRTTLQTIELLCNARDVVQELELDDMRTLARLFEQPERLPGYIRGEVADYLDNKGTRSWDTADRRIMPEAWREAELSLMTT